MRRCGDRPLDARGDRVDVCPTCGGTRTELPAPVVPDRFYCHACKASTVGPNTEAPPPPPPEQIDLFDVGPAGQNADDDRPPIDDYDLEAPPDET